MIFICHDCKVSTYEVGADKYVSADLKYEGTQRAKANFEIAHAGHELRFESDAHGQISPTQYNFRIKEFEGYF